jgi:hypothetical protein
MARLRAVSLAVLLAATLGAGAARADSNLFVGVGEDNLMGRPAQTAAIARDLGVKAFRLSLMWEPGQTQLAPHLRAGLDNAVVPAAAAGRTR